MKKIHAQKMITNFKQFDEPVAGSNTSEIEILKCGEWDHPTYGKMLITQDMLDQFVMNFNAGTRKGICITEGHPVGDQELPAVGWFKELKKKGSDSLIAVVEWNQRGLAILSDKLYKFFSPEFFFNYEDPETRMVTKNVLTGGALTNKPYFKSLEAVVMSERYLISKENNSMNLEAILAKEPKDVTAEEKAFMETMIADLDAATIKKFELAEKKASAKKEVAADDDEKDMSEDDKKAFAAMTPEEKKAFKAKKAAEKEACEKKAAEEAEAAKIEAAEKEKKAMSENEAKEKLTLAEGKLQAAEKELQEFRMREKEALITGEIGKVVASETNKTAGFLPTSSEKIKEFAMNLDADDRKVFFEILAEAKKSQLFDETGSGEDGIGSIAGKAKDGTPIDAESHMLAEKASQIAASEKIDIAAATIKAAEQMAK